MKSAGLAVKNQAGFQPRLNAPWMHVMEMDTFQIWRDDPDIWTTLLQVSGPEHWTHNKNQSNMQMEARKI